MPMLKIEKNITNKKELFQRPYPQLEPSNLMRSKVNVREMGYPSHAL